MNEDQKIRRTLASASILSAVGDIEYRNTLMYKPRFKDHTAPEHVQEECIVDAEMKRDRKAAKRLRDAAAGGMQMHVTREEEIADIASDFAEDFKAVAGQKERK